MKCRFCKTALDDVFIDLFNSPASNSFLTRAQLNEPETYFPLKVFTCPSCFLVQLDEYQSSAEHFSNDYVYFSSYSTSWLAHAKRYTEAMTARFGLNQQSQVMEIASNDGYLLQYFLEQHIPVLGIEPTKNTAAVAVSKGIETMTEFFGVSFAEKLADTGRKADLLLGNNVLAHVPDINDFVGGMKILLKPEGVITMEFPHLYQLVANNQFDTVYHEHFSYLSFYTVQQVFAKAGLTLFDVEELSTHGGSLRIYGKHTENSTHALSPRVEAMLQKEASAGMKTMAYYQSFQQAAEKIKLDLLAFLVEQKKAGKKVAAYGAAAKGNTLLNFCGVKADLIEYVVDANPHKQDKFLPASHIPVVNEQYLKEHKPDYVIILPWNLKEEITHQLSYIRNWNAEFVVAIPSLQTI